jgi:hypothetical protein
MQDNDYMQECPRRLQFGPGTWTCGFMSLGLGSFHMVTLDCHMQETAGFAQRLEGSADRNVSCLSKTQEGTFLRESVLMSPLTVPSVTLSEFQHCLHVQARSPVAQAEDYPSIVPRRSIHPHAGRISPSQFSNGRAVLPFPSLCPVPRCGKHSAYSEWTPDLTSGGGFQKLLMGGN